MNPPSILERLRSDAPGDPLDRLATLVVEEDLDTPVGRLIDPAFAGDLLHKGLRAWLASDEAEAWLLGRLQSLREWLEDRDASVGQLLPDELQTACLELAGRRHVPDREVTLFLLDREPVHRLLRDLLLEELLTFGRKLRAPVVENPLAKGLGGLGRFARDRARTSGGAFGALASEMASAVGDELERQIDRKATDFADAALSRVLQRLANLLCDPARAGEQAALRRTLVEAIFELEAFDLAGELERSDPAAVSGIVRRALAAWVGRDAAARELSDILEATFAPDAGRPLREVLADLGLLESYVELAHAATARRLRSLVAAPAFGAWLGELLARPPRP